MAIDTVSKLHSMISYGDIFQIGVPIPDGAFDQGDLQHLLHGYSGVLWTKAVIVGDTITGVACVTMTAKQIGIAISSKQIGIAITGKQIGIDITGGCSCQ